MYLKNTIDFLEPGHNTSSCWYVLASQSLPGRWSDLRPYMMFDELEPDATEASLEGAEETSAWVNGLGWDVIASARAAVALKADFRSEEVGVIENDLFHFRRDR